MEHSSSNVAGTAILLAGLVLTFIGLSVADHTSKLGFAFAGMIVAFVGRLIKEYEWLD